MCWWAEKQWRDNIFTKQYGEHRAFCDGKAQLAEELYTILEGLNND